MTVSFQSFWLFTLNLLINLFISLLISQTSIAAETLSSEDFLALALKQNLDLRLAKAETKVIGSSASGIRIPAPSVGFTQMNMQGGQTAQGWQVSQTIPFPTKILRDHSARKYALEAQKQDEQVIDQELRAQAKYIYFLIWETQEQKSVLKEKKDVLLKHIRIAKSVAQSDTFAKIHVLKAESEVDLLENELELVSQVHRERQSMAAQFLNKEPGVFKIEVTNPGLSTAPNISSVEETPQIQSLNKRLKSYQALEKVGHAEWLPDFTVGYSHMDDTMRFPPNNQIMVGITLPFVYFWQADAKSKESTAQKLKTEINLYKTKRNIQAEKVNLESALQTFERQISTLKNKILPKAVKRKKLFQNVAPRDLSTLQEHLDTHLAIPDIRLQILSLQSKYEQTVSMLSRYKTHKGSAN